MTGELLKKGAGQYRVTGIVLSSTAPTTVSNPTASGLGSAAAYGGSQQQQQQHHQRGSKRGRDAEQGYQQEHSYSQQPRRTQQQGLPTQWEQQHEYGHGCEVDYHEARKQHDEFGSHQQQRGPPTTAQQQRGQQHGGQQQGIFSSRQYGGRGGGGGDDSRSVSQNQGLSQLQQQHPDKEYDPDGDPAGLLGNHRMPPSQFW